MEEGDAMIVYFRCSACKGDHASPIQFRDEGMLERSRLPLNRTRCPETKHMVELAKKDMFWRADRDGCP